MRRRRPVTEEVALRAGYGVAGLALTASAALAADLALEHMALLGVVCGASPHPHCGWCYGAAGLALAGLAAFAASLGGPGLLRKPGLLQIKADKGQG